MNKSRFSVYGLLAMALSVCSNLSPAQSNATTAAANTAILAAG